MTDLQRQLDAELSAATAAIDFDTFSAAYHQQDELVFSENALPRPLLDTLLGELRPLLADSVHRNYVPGVRKGGNVGFSTIRARAPVMDALYRSPVVVDFMSRLAGRELVCKSLVDDHACALYVYTRKGDGMRFHYDTCGCEVGASYTAIIGLIDRSSSRFVARLHTKTQSAAVRELEIATKPGSMLFFRGSNIFHAVSPLRRGEERVVLSLSYVTPGRRAKGIRRFTENAKDALLYFGPRALLQRNYFERE